MHSPQGLAKKSGVVPIPWEAQQREASGFQVKSGGNSTNCGGRAAFPVAAFDDSLPSWVGRGREMLELTTGILAQGAVFVAPVTDTHLGVAAVKSWVLGSHSCFPCQK